MTCADHQENFLAYLDQVLDVEDVSVIEAHLEQCPWCTQKLQVLVDSIVQGDLVEELRQTLASEAPKILSEETPRPRWAYQKSLAAGSLVAAAIIGVFFLLNFHDREDSRDSRAPRLEDLVDKNSAPPPTYRLRNQRAKLESVLQFHRSGGFIQKSALTGMVERVAGKEESLGWEFDNRTNAVFVSSEDSDANLADAKSYVETLSKKFRPVGQVQTQHLGHACWRFDFESRDGVDEQIRLFVDSQGVIRSRQQFLSGELVEILDLIEDSGLLREGELDLSRFVTEATQVAVLGEEGNPRKLPFGMMVGMIKRRANLTMTGEEIPFKILDSDFFHDLIGEFETRANGKKWSKMFGFSRNEGLLKPSSAFPKGLLRPLPSSLLKEIKDLDAFTAKLARQCQVEIEAPASRAARIVTMNEFGGVPIPAFQLLNIAAMAHNMTIEVEGQRVILKAQD